LWFVGAGVSLVAIRESRYPVTGNPYVRHKVCYLFKKFRLLLT